MDNSQSQPEVPPMFARLAPLTSAMKLAWENLAVRPYTYSSSQFKKGLSHVNRENLKRVVIWITTIVSVLVGAVGIQSARMTVENPKVKQLLDSSVKDVVSAPDNAMRFKSLLRAAWVVIQSAYSRTETDVRSVGEYTGLVKPVPELTTSTKIKAFVAKNISDVLKNMSPTARWAYGLTLAALMVGAMGLHAMWPSIRRRVLEQNKVKNVKTPLDGAKTIDSPKSFFSSLIPYSLSIRDTKSKSKSTPKLKSKSKSHSRK
jgi:hypothetical protein